MGTDFEELKDREYKECLELAEKIIKRAAKTITENVPELGVVLDSISLSLMDKEIKLSTDGERIYFNPKKVVLARQKKGLSEIQFQLLHVTLHILRGDIITYRQSPHKELLGAIMDAEIYGAIMGLKENGGYDSSKQNKDYYGLKYDKSAAFQFISEARDKYSCDDHSFWNKYVKSTDEMQQDLERLLENIFGKEVKNQIMNGNLSFLEEFADKFGEKLRISFNLLSGNISLSEKSEYAVGKSKTNYKKVIENLLEEVCVEKESPEIIDRNLYCYGLEMYGDIPLVEPGEDETIIRGVKGRLAIAIDTSGSTQGEMVERFLGEIGKLISQLLEGSPDNEFEVVVFECDCRITKEEHFLNNEILKAFKGKRSLLGGGGTSFLPVFKKIKELENKGDMGFSGLIYFSDGYGDFPKENPIPEVPVIFVLPEDGNYRKAPDIPGYVKITHFK